MKFRTSHYLSILLAASLLAACASVPLSTLWKARSLGPEDLAQVEPGDLRAAVQSEPVFFDSLPPARLSFNIDIENQPAEQYEFRLLPTPAYAPVGLDAAETGQRWQIFELDRAELADFKAMQLKMLNRINTGFFERNSGSFGLSLSFTRKADDPEAANAEAYEAAARRWQEDGFPLAIAVQLFPEDGYLMLMKPTRVDFTYNPEK